MKPKSLVFKITWGFFKSSIMILDGQDDSSWSRWPWMTLSLKLETKSTEPQRQLQTITSRCAVWLPGGCLWPSSVLLFAFWSVSFILIKAALLLKNAGHQLQELISSPLWPAGRNSISSSVSLKPAGKLSLPPLPNIFSCLKALIGQPVHPWTILMAEEWDVLIG